MKWLLWCFLMIGGNSLFAQHGILIGNILDENKKALEGASVQLISFSDTVNKKIVATDKNGYFEFDKLPFDYYRLQVSFVGLQSTTIDSIHVRAERFDFNLGDIVLKARSTNKMDEIIIYAEKPLIQTKDGNITYNASESALSNGSNASDLLANVPLVTKDPNGKVLVRGKEPKILIDDKPVELNLQQLQDLLESMPGSSVEKIEVMTNPPPQYANEQGGVINIVTKKGAVGMGGRLTAYAGSRGEVGGNASFNYRRQGLVFTLNAGAARNVFDGYGYSDRENLYVDSTNHFKTNNEYTNRSTRPNIRLNLDYELNKFHALNLVFHYNQNTFNNTNLTTYRNLNYLGDTYRLSTRSIGSTGDNYSPGVNISYTLRTKTAGENLKIHTNANFSDNNNIRNFYEQFFNPDFTFNGSDSAQTQITDNRTHNYNVRVNYDRPLGNKKTHISVGSYYNTSKSLVKTDALYKRKADGSMAPLDALSNHFAFYQHITNVRGSVKQLLGPNFSTTLGLAAEETKINFDLFKFGTDTANSYWTMLPFATLNKTWKDILNVSLAYRRTIRRPGIGELNPTIDLGDPYNIRFGNPDLEASTSHNFDLVIGRTKNAFYANMGFGYNIVADIFSQIRSLRADGKTEVTWQNISGRKEYEVSTWSGYTVNKKLRLNVSASYTHNVYSAYDKEFRRFRDGGSLTSNLNTNYTLKDLYIATGNFTVSRFANPQGKVRSNVSMNLGFQAKMLNKKLTVSLNAIDPFIQQQNKVVTYGKNFNLESFSSTQTRSYRVTLNYNLTKTPKPKKKITPQKKTVPVNKVN